MTKILPPPFIPPAVFKIIPSLAPTRLSQLARPPHLANLIAHHSSTDVTGKAIKRKYIAQRCRLIKTGTADLYHQIAEVVWERDRVSRVKAQGYYRGYPIYKTPRWLPTINLTDVPWDFVSGRGKLLVQSEFTKERNEALKQPGVAQMLMALGPKPKFNTDYSYKDNTRR